MLKGDGVARLQHGRIDLLGNAKHLAHKLSPAVQFQLRAIYRGIIRRRLRRRAYIVNDVGRRLYVEPADPRAEMLAAMGGRMARDVIELWIRLVQELSPDLVIDVGANYGEVVLATHYPAHARIVVVEANPAVAAFLSRSIAASGLAVEVVVAAASARSGEIDLYVSDGSSGLSSVDRRVGSALRVPAVRLDDILVASRGNVVAKIDVEGHEQSVMAGMQRIFGACQDYALIVEWSNGDYDAITQLHIAHQVALVRKADLSEVQSTPATLRSHLLDLQRSDFIRDIVLRPVRSYDFAMR
jgi:FkbM family methyltransferase